MNLDVNQRCDDFASKVRAGVAIHHKHIDGISRWYYINNGIDYILNYVILELSRMLYSNSLVTSRKFSQQNLQMFN